jgi:DNA-binding protein YbaB
LTEPGDRAALEARNAAIREQVDSLLEKFNEQSRQLQEAQTAAAAATATVTSSDGLVTATVDSSGMLTKLEFAEKSFQRTDPARFARTVTETVRSAAMQVKQQMSDLMAPITEGLPDLSDLVEGAPSLKGLMPKMPDFTEQPSPPQPEPRAEAPNPNRRRPASADPDDDEPGSWLVGGR